MNTTAIFTQEEISRQAKRVLQFSAFQNSPILSRFLEYIIDETIHQRELHLKEYSIAVNVLRRLPDFNPHDDAVVRIHAGRLRRALNEYYLIDGINDPIIIKIPKGCYVPQFESGCISSTPLFFKTKQNEKEQLAVVAVFPFRIVSNCPEVELFGELLGEKLSAALFKFPEISVIGYYPEEVISKMNENILEAGKQVNADFLITGSIQYIENHFRVLVCLLSAASGEILMSKSFDRQIAPLTNFEMEDQIVESVVCAVAGYHGIVFQEMMKAEGKFSTGSTVRKAIYSYYLCQRTYSIENFTTAFRAVSQALKDFPANPVIMAMLGELYVSGIGLGNKTVIDPLREGYYHVLQAIKIDPFCQQAWHSKALVHLFRKERDACRNAVLQCFEINPNSSFLISDLGFILICAGFFDEGFIRMDKEIKLNPFYPWWVHVGFCFYFIHKNDFDSAMLWAERVDSEDTFWDPLLKCVTLGYLGNKEDSKKCAERLMKNYPTAMWQLPEMLSSFLLSEDLLAKIFEGLKKAGFNQDE